MKLRGRLTKWTEEKLREGHLDEYFDKGLTSEECALHVQGVFWHTGCVQLSEAMAHLCLALAQHPEIQDRCNEDGKYLSLAIQETMRVFPLFGVAHRILDSDIELPDGRGVIPKVCLFVCSRARAKVNLLFCLGLGALF